ncbi:MAG: guanylate kinase [Rhodothalassiaceae bacterium]
MSEGTIRQGLLIIISSPSGAGKSTLCEHLMREEGERLWMSVSTTTRPRRMSEVDGQDYHFVSREKFERMVENGEFLEHAEVFGHFYGTPREPVEERLRAGIDVLFDIDWQGAKQIAERMREARVVSIFILPPSLAALEERLRRRAQDSEETVRYRMSRAREEIAHWEEYDYVLVNDDLDRCFRKLQAIVTAERVRAARDGPVRALAKQLLGDD